MRASLLISLLLAGLALGASAAQNTSALKALKLVPKDDLKQLAQIVGPDGAPVPERWYILVHTKSNETGVKEFVVADGELVATRQVSQFAESLSADAVINSAKLVTDSDKLTKLAQDYAEANAVSVSRFTFTLEKGIASSAPVWKVTCLNDGGEERGALTVSSSTGKVLSHEGFPTEPARKTARKTKKLKLETTAMPQVAVDLPASIPDPAVDSSSDTARAQDSTPREAIAESSDTSRSAHGTEEERKSSGRRARSSAPDPVTTVRGVTRPFRKAIGRILPF